MTLVREYQPTFVLGDGETKEFSFLFEEVSANFVKVIVKHSDNSTYVPVFSVDLDSHKVVFGESETAPLDTDLVCIYRETPDLQDTPFRTLQGYDARALENILSKIVAMIQELKANGFSTQILQGTPWQLDLLHPADDNASVVIDYNARILKKGLYFQIVSGNLQVSADGSSFISMPKSADITEFRCLETVLEDLTVVRKLQYKVNNVWYDAEHNAQATADEALTLAQTVQSDLSSHKLNTNNPHQTSLGNLTDTDFTNLSAGNFIMFDGLKWKNVYSSATASWGTLLGDINDQTDLMIEFAKYVKTDGSSTMTNPLMMRATEDFKCAIAPYWDGVGFFKLNDNNSVTLMASIEYNSGFEPATTNTYNIGASIRKWKNLYLSGKAYVATINNGADILVPTSGGTMALLGDIITTLSGLTDVTIESLVSGQVLQWDGTKWVNASTNLSPMTGATASTDGAEGVVPTPHAGDQDKVLKGDGTWRKIDDYVGGDGIIFQPAWTTAIQDNNLGDYIWLGVAFGNSKFVALGANGYVSTSTDGITWTTAVQDSNLGLHVWQAIAFDGTKFVALGYNGYISTSTDGITWTTAVQDSNLGAYSYWCSLVYDGTKFVALGNSGYISTSTDGITWTTAVQDSNLGVNWWRSLAFDETKFVALGLYGYVSTSTDGTTWTTAVQDSNLGVHAWRAIAFDGTKFVALGNDGRISTSTDGTTWTAAVQDSNLGVHNWSDIAFGNGKFIALGENGYISTSTYQQSVNVINKADIDLSNVNSTGKANSVSWIMPDWSRVISTNLSGIDPISTTSDTYTCPSDGWIYFYATRTHAGYTLKFIVNNNIKHEFAAYTANYANMIYPVSAGDVIKLIADDSSPSWHINWCNFVPCKGS